MKKELDFNETKENMLKKCKFVADLLAGWEIIGAVIAIVAIIIILYSIISTGNTNIVELLNDSEFITYMGTDINWSMIKNTSLGWIGFGIILDCLRRILVNTSKFETPFIKTNIDIFKVLLTASVILFIFTNKIGIVTICLIYVIYAIFKYACFLQQESDETI